MASGKFEVPGKSSDNAKDESNALQQLTAFSLNVFVQEGVACSNQGNFNMAIAIFERIVKICPDNSELLVLLAQQYINANHNYNRAKELLDTAIALRNAQAKYLRASLHVWSFNHRRTVDLIKYLYLLNCIPLLKEARLEGVENASPLLEQVHSCLKEIDRTLLNGNQEDVNEDDNKLAAQYAAYLNLDDFIQHQSKTAWLFFKSNSQLTLAKQIKQALDHSAQSWNHTLQQPTLLSQLKQYPSLNEIVQKIPVNPLPVVSFAECQKLVTQSDDVGKAIYELLLLDKVIANEGLKILAQHKEEVVEYVRQLSTDNQPEAISSILRDSKSQLFKFFRVQRGFLTPRLGHGTLKEIQAIEEQYDVQAMTLH